MKLKRRIKAHISAALAAAMVFTMAAPALPAYAVNYLDPVEIHFDPDIGPDLSHASNGYAALTRVASGGRNISVAKGKAGELLTSSTDFNGIPTEKANGDPNTKDRPELPKFQANLWTGYSFDGWYKSSGAKLAYLPEGFEYETPVTYTSRWTPDSAQKFRFTVMHYRDLSAERNAKTDASAWVSGSEPDILAFRPGGLAWEKEVSTGEKVHDSYRRDIPGYILQDALIKNNKRRRFGELSGQGTINENGAELSAENNVKGDMPNDDLTVAYRYKPNPGTKFSLRAEYVKDAGGGMWTSVHEPESRAFSAESDVSLSPSGDVSEAYRLLRAEFVEGTEADPGLCVYGMDAAALDTATGALSGKMPNQNVKIRYVYELDPNYTAGVVVNYVDGNGNPMSGHPQQTLSFGLGAHDVPAPKVDGYHYPPLITANPSRNFTERTVPASAAGPAEQKFSFTLENGGGEITMQYAADEADPSFWTRVTYPNPEHGEITGLTSPRSFQNGAHPLLEDPSNPAEALTSGITVTPRPHYEFDGWYKADSAGKKTGNRLSGTLELDGTTLRLLAVFRENPDDWFDLRFVNGANGSISGNLTAHVERGTRWSDLAVPTTSPAANYLFEGWFNDAGARMDTNPNAEIQASQTFTARFRKIGSVEDGVLAIPDAEGGVERDGSGSIRIDGANDRRRYALTDREGNVIAVKSGTELQSGAFTGLPVCEQYRVYELEEHQNPAPGSDILSVDPNKRSQPAAAVVPAVGENYSVAEDAAGTVKLTVKPAAADTVYALVDADGNVVPFPSAQDGFLTPSGSPPAVEFTGLTPNRVYTVVARPASGQESAESKLPMGSTLTLTGAVNPGGAEYRLTILNGGKATEITSNGAAQAVGGEGSELGAKKGDQIKIEAPAQNSGNQNFLRWSVLIGGMRISFPERNRQTVTMPEGDVILRAEYEGDLASPANARLDYAPKDGRFAPDPDGGSALEELRQALIDNAADRQVLARTNPPAELLYTLHFHRRSVPASTSDALKEQTGEDKLKLPWRLGIGLSREVDGVNKPVSATPGNAFRVVASLSRALMGNMDYRLYKEEPDGAGGASFTEVPMSPDPNEEDFQGILGFEAHIGDKLILSYVRGYTVKVSDTKRGTLYTLRVREGDALEDADGYDGMRRELELDYTDPATGIVYELDALRKKNSASAPEWESGSEVKKDLTLYAFYTEADDAAWRAAAQKLTEEINIANTLANDGTVSPEDRARLDAAVREATELRNRIPRPSVSELEEACGRLKAVVDEIRNSGGTNNPAEPNNPNNPTNPNNPNSPNNPNPGSSGGHGGGGGGGGRGGSSVSVNAGPGFRKVYHSGMDGSWDNFDPAGHGWAFVLRNGTRLSAQWADIVYTFEGVSRKETYHFNAEGVMDSGWYCDGSGDWYYLSTLHDGWFGSLKRGWHLDPQDQRWYFLSMPNGKMVTGWQEVDGDWYYLTPANTQQTWFYDAEEKKWNYGRGSGRPLGSMYAGETTPDGYPVDRDGAWVRETP